MCGNSRPGHIVFGDISGVGELWYVARIADKLACSAFFVSFFVLWRTDIEKYFIKLH